MHSHCTFLQKSANTGLLPTALFLILYHLNIAYCSLELDFTSDQGTAIISCMVARQQTKKELMIFYDAGDNSYLRI